MAKVEAAAQNNWIDAFLLEAQDLLAEIDDAALELSDGVSTETIHRIFRAFHTLKGSSGMCGLTVVADFTHHIETLLDKVRGGEIPATPKLADLVLACRDQVAALIAADQGGQPVPAGSSERMIEQLLAFAAKDGAQPKSDTADEIPMRSLRLSGSGDESTWAIHFRPNPELFKLGGNPIALMRELSTLGVLEITTHTDFVPPLEEIEADVCHLWWSGTLRTSAKEEDIRDVFMFVEDGSELEITLQTRPASAPGAGKPSLSEVAAKPSVVRNDGAQRRTDAVTAAALAKESTVRVPSARLDRLVNLVGELVMNQSRITQMMTQTAASELTAPVQEIERLVAELRDDVLGIRMLPIGTLFNRFRRMVHDLAQELGKEIDLITEGAETELDKSILDQLGEPLVHMLRNSIDHGIEPADEREANGKPRRGTIWMRAVHAGSNVVVSIQDDGRGINRAAVRAKAVERQLISGDANLSDKETLNLLLLPGFSTAERITNVSGRGVGMDVVKRQIDSLRGSITIASQEGKGTSMSLKLPLTLAIIEGLLVQLGECRLIIPMSAVTENVELQAAERRGKNGRNVVDVRGELIPYIDLRALFQIDGNAPQIEKIVIVEYEEHRVGIVVDRVLSTHQTVLQPLGRFFRTVTVVSGATIMGDGGVALILDIGSIVTLANRGAR